MMGERIRMSLIRCSWLLQVALLAMVGYVPSSLGIDCYCHEYPYHRFAICFFEGSTCSGDVCYVRKVLQDNGVIYTKWGCLNNDVHHVNLLCGGAFDKDTERYSCCNGTTNCNEHLPIVLPIEMPGYSAPTTSSILPSSPTTTVGEEGSSSLSSGHGEGDSPLRPYTTAVLPSHVPVTSASSSMSTPKPELVPTSTPSTHPPDSPHLKCFCSSCSPNEVACGSGGSCYVHKEYTPGQNGGGASPFSISWGCLNKSESDQKCHGRSKDYQCCSNKDFCNQQLLIDERTTAESTTSTSAECNSVSGGCRTNALQDKLILCTVVAVVVALVLTVTILVFIVILWMHIIKLRRRKSIKAASSSSDSSANSVSTESESLPSPTSTSSTHHYLCISHVDEPAFGDSVQFSGSKA